MVIKLTQNYAPYGWYEIRQDDVEEFVYWAGGTTDDKGEDILNRNEKLIFDPRYSPIGSKVYIHVPVNEEGDADWPQFKEIENGD